MTRKFAGMGVSDEVLAELRAGGVTDRDIEDSILDVRLFNARLTPERLAALQRETRWFMDLVRAGTPPTPEEMARHAPTLIAAVEELDD